MAAWAWKADVMDVEHSGMDLQAATCMQHGIHEMNSLVETETGWGVISF